MKRILYVRNDQQSFIKVDKALLEERWQLEDLNFTSPKMNPLAIMRAVWRNDLIFCWWASWHSLMPVLFARLLGKPTLVVVGGYDTANVPEADYGSQRGGLRRWIACTVIKTATHLLVNSESAQREAIANAGADPEKITVVYHGFEPLPFGDGERERLVITVGGIWQENMLRKGLLPFVRSAAHLPDVRFVHIGKWYDDSIKTLRTAAGDNVEFKGFVSDEDLLDFYQRAAVYVQASMHEGFGMSVAEAMSTGCIPVVTHAGALPEVVGETGVYAESNGPADIAKAIESALQVDADQRVQASQRVMTEFPMERRRVTLHKLVQDLLS
jgi:glycosyltransferase involved in cell wall biosynthesis